MFVQVRPWLDCDRGCEFCYLSDAEKHTDVQYKRKALMNTMKILGDEAMVHQDRIGLIGGELFCFEGLNAEWRCVADIICSIQPKTIFIGTHLLSGVDRLLRFARMLRGKDVQVCTSYDTLGRFKDEEEKALWFANLQKVHDAGFRTVVSCTLTDAFLKDDVQFPEWVELRVQPIFYTETWLNEIHEWCTDGEEYNANLLLNVSADSLAKRKDAIEWFKNHPEVAKAYSEYSDKHATLFYDFDGNEYQESEFICSTYLSKCGHPMIAHCYGDSGKCTMCDAKSVIGW